MTAGTARSGTRQRRIRFPRRATPRLSRQARATLVRQMASLAHVLPISDAVATLCRQPSGRAAEEALRHTHRHLQGGMALADALPKDAFPPTFRAIIAAGEASGQLPLVLSRLADSLEAEAAFRARLVSTLAYPVLLVLVAIAVIAAMLAFVVPAIAEQLADAGAPLPFLTRAVIGLSSFLAATWWVLLLLVLALVAGVVILLRDTGRRLRFDRAILGLPLVGSFLAGASCVHWARTLGTMLSAGLPLADALSITAPTLRNHAWQAATREITTRVEAGTSLTATLPLLPHAPPMVVALVQSGEASGRLAALLESAATTLDRQLSDRSKTLLSLAEPLIILGLGAIVALIILAVLLPILKLNTLAGSGLGGIA